MLNAAIYGMGRWGGRLIDSVKDSDKIRLVKGVTRNPAAHKELAAKTGLDLGDGRVLVPTYDSTGLNLVVAVATPTPTSTPSGTATPTGTSVSCVGDPRVLPYPDRPERPICLRVRLRCLQPRRQDSGLGKF